MPSTRSRAATKCISEVPGLVKQTSTPPATRVRTRLSAPFIRSTPVREVGSFDQRVLQADQPLFGAFVKGDADKAVATECKAGLTIAAAAQDGLTRAWLAKARQLWPCFRT